MINQDKNAFPVLMVNAIGHAGHVYTLAIPARAVAPLRDSTSLARIRVDDELSMFRRDLPDCCFNLPVASAFRLRHQSEHCAPAIRCGAVLWMDC